jgi:glucose-6-phosphate isomerase
MIEVDYSNMIFPICSEGIKKDDLKVMSDKLEAIRKDIASAQENYGYLNLPFSEDVVEEIVDFVKEKKDKYENFVVLGIGGSALGNLAMFQALCSTSFRLFSNIILIT